MKKKLNKAEMQEALAAKGVSFGTKATNPELEALCLANGIATEVEAAVIEKVVVFGVELTPKSPNEATIVAYVAAKAAKEFPNFIGKIPPGKYSTTGTCDVFVWNHLDSTTGKMVQTSLLVIFITDGTNLYPVGSWDVCRRTTPLSLQGEKEGERNIVEPKWVEPSTFTSNSDRDRLATNVPAGIQVVVKEGVGHWFNVMKEANARDFMMRWLERADDAE